MSSSVVNIFEITFQDKLNLLKYKVDEICRPQLMDGANCREASKKFIELMDEINKKTKVSAQMTLSSDITHIWNIKSDNKDVTDDKDVIY